MSYLKSKIEGHRFHQLNCAVGRSYGLQSKVSNKIYSEPLKHALSPHKGPIESFSILSKVHSEHCAIANHCRIQTSAWNGSHVHLCFAWFQMQFNIPAHTPVWEIKSHCYSSICIVTTVIHLQGVSLLSEKNRSNI